jgi:hypothetical protein
LSRRLQGRVDDSDVLQEAYLDAARKLPEYAADPRLPVFLWLRHLTGLKLAEVHRRHLGAQLRDADRERTLRPDLPRDLETIINKAIEKSSGDRYPSAAELAADLQRFLDDEPIQARRLTGGERAWRWCRRHPVEAALIAGIQLTLVGLIVLGAWSNARISRALTDKDQALVDKGTALADTEAARNGAVKLRDAAIAETYRALLSETRALRLAHLPGWRNQALQKLGSLAHLKTPRRDLTELRGEAIACIGEFDAVKVMEFVGHTEPIWSLAFNPDGTRLASAGFDGRLQIWDVTEGRWVQEITEPAANVGRQYFDTSPLPAVRFHPADGRLAYVTWIGASACCHWGRIGNLPPASGRRRRADTWHSTAAAVCWPQAGTTVGSASLTAARERLSGRCKRACARTCISPWR